MPRPNDSGPGIIPISQNTVKADIPPRKAAPRNGESGEHYITRTPKEYIHLIKSAIGGGVLTAFTAVFKFLIHHLNFEAFFNGLLASLNYSISFLAIHFSHFTLGTKQPSSTAPALAARMESIDNPAELSELTDEIVHIIRSQFSAIFGNIIGVVPITLALCWVFLYLFSVPLISSEEAMHVLESFSIKGMTPIYAAFTGVLL